MDNVHDDSWLNEQDDGTDIAITGADVEQEAPKSDYAVKLDQWGKRRGRDLAEEPAIKELGISEEDAADMHAMAFELEPELLEQCSNDDKLEYLQMLQQTPEYQQLHVDTQMDTTASEMAAVGFSREYYKLVQSRKKEQEKQQNQPNDPNAKPDPHADLKKEMQAMAAARKAAKEAQQDVNDLNDAREAMGIGKDAGQTSGMSQSEVKRLFKKVKGNAQLKRICDLAGKYRLMARAKQRNKVIHGLDDTVGIVMDNDIGRMLPHEMAAMSDDDLEWDAMRRFVERQMLCRELKGVQNVAKGPIIVAIDESGSMSGDKICQAKALAMAMAWIARQQNRWCGLVGWASRGHLRQIALPPNRWPTSEVMDWLTNFLNGGTHIPVEDLPATYAKLGAAKGKTDIIFITDGDVPPIDSTSLKKFKTWKQEVGAKIITISIQSRAEAFKPISEEYYEITKLHVNDEAVGKVLSI